jgi:hypothetical protein
VQKVIMSDQIEINKILDKHGTTEKQKEIILELYSLLDDKKKVDFIRYLNESQ